MPITWDEPKRLANIGKHGLDFATFQDGFNWDEFLAEAVRPSRTGRGRYRLIGNLEDEGLVIAIVSPLGSEAISIVSLRRATRKERSYYARWAKIERLQ